MADEIALSMHRPKSHSPEASYPPIAVVGLTGSGLEGLTGPALAAIASARLVVGGRRHLQAAESLLGSLKDPPRRLAFSATLGPVLDALEDNAGPACVLASGDPGFFGIARALAERFGRFRLRIHPAPSSISLAFARMGLSWDDATVVSAHGRPLALAARAAAEALGSATGGAGAKAAVLCSPSAPPEAIGAALKGLGVQVDLVAVCTALGGEDEAVEEVSLDDLAEGSWEPLSVLVLACGPTTPPDPALSWRGSSEASQVGGGLLRFGRPEEEFEHRSSMVTKAEVRAIVLSKLSLPADGVMWDLGAGSGSVGIEAALLSPGLEVTALERNRDDCERIRRNADRLSASIAVLEGVAPQALAGMADPHRCFIGGGGIGVLDAALERLRPGGRLVATYASLQRAHEAASRLGAMEQISAARGVQLPDGSWRLEAANPVFLAWGPLP